MPDRNKTYCIIDDDPDDQQFLSEALLENDPAAHCVNYFNGQEAIIQLKKNFPALPDVIFLDLNMPRYAGKQFLVEIKKMTAFQLIPIIVYSTSSNQKEIQEMLRLGALYFMTKKSSFGGLCKELATLFYNMGLSGILHSD
jgi:CheY-like chemotaxis protein